MLDNGADGEFGLAYNDMAKFSYKDNTYTYKWSNKLLYAPDRLGDMIFRVV
jgi:hypothetical protein